MSVTTVRLRPEVEKSLEAIADESRRSKSWVINEALSQYISERKVQQVRWRQTLEAMESVAQGQVVAGEKVHAWLQSWGTQDEITPPQVDE